jgi:hypothetical protein
MSRIHNTGCTGSRLGSGWIGVTLPEPDRHSGPADPDPTPFQPNVEPNYTFSKNFNILSKNINNFVADEIVQDPDPDLDAVGINVEIRIYPQHWIIQNP